MRGYNKGENINNEPLILEPEDWTEEEYKVLQKVFGCPENTTRIKVEYSPVEWFEERKLKKNQSKYVMIVTSEDERYDRGETDISFYACEPWEGLLEEVVFGNRAEELYGDGKNEGLFYQVYETETGKRIGYGTIDPDYPREDIEEWEKEHAQNESEKPWYEEQWCLDDILNAMSEVGVIPTKENIEKVKTLCITAFSDLSERNEYLKQIIENEMR